MQTIGSRHWLEESKREWERREGRLLPSRRRDFDAVRAFRGDVLREVSDQRPRTWWGGLPWILHDREERSALSPKFVMYLDNRLEMHGWRGRLRFLQHQDLNWWKDRLEEIE